MRNSSYSSPPGPNKHLAAHTAQPGSLPRMLQPTLCPGGASVALSCEGPGDLIVLKHSSYCLIFRCPLSLVSDLHICWNTVGCSLCSSDQLGISLVLRGSGLCSHLSRRHLFNQPIYLFLDRGEGREKERERNISGWLPLTWPHWGPVPQPMRVP